MKLSQLTSLDEIGKFLKKTLYKPDGRKIEDNDGIEVFVSMDSDTSKLQFSARLSVFGEDDQEEPEDIFDSKGLKEYQKALKEDRENQGILEKAFSNMDGYGTVGAL